MLFFGTDLLCGWTDYFQRSQQEYCIALRCFHILCIPLLPLDLHLVHNPPRGIGPVLKDASSTTNRSSKHHSSSFLQNCNYDGPSMSTTPVLRAPSVALYLKLWLFAWIRFVALGLLHWWCPMTTRSEAALDTLFRSCGIQVTVFSTFSVGGAGSPGDEDGGVEVLVRGQEDGMDSAKDEDATELSTVQPRLLKSLSPFKIKFTSRQRREKLPSSDSQQTISPSHTSENGEEKAGGSGDESDSVENTSLTTGQSVQRKRRGSLPSSVTKSLDVAPPRDRGTTGSISPAARAVAMAADHESSGAVLKEIIARVGCINSSSNDASSCVALGTYMVRRDIHFVTLPLHAYNGTDLGKGNARDVSVVDIFLLALKRDPSCVPAMVRVAECMRELDRLEMGVVEAIADDARERSPTPLQSPRRGRTTSNSNDQFIVSLDRTTVYSKILALDPSQSAVWNTLGLLLLRGGGSATQVIAPRGGLAPRSVSALDCFVEAIEADKDNVEALCNLAKCVPGGHTVVLHGETLTATTIMLRAVRLESNNAVLYAMLASLMTPSQVVTLPLRSSTCTPTSMSSQPSASATATPSPEKESGIGKRRLDQHQVLLEAIDVAVEMNVPIPLPAQTVARAMFMCPQHATLGITLPSGRRMTEEDFTKFTQQQRL